MKKTMFVYDNIERFGETTFFFDDTEVITAIDGNDGNYRSEYMDCLFEHFKISVETVSRLNPKQKQSLLQYCEDNGIEIRKKVREATEKNYDYYSVRLSSPFDYQDVRFYIKRDLPYAEELLKICQKNASIEDRQYQGCEDVGFHFKKDALESTKEGNGNYLTSSGYLSDRIMVEEIIHPSKVKMEESERTRRKLKKWTSWEDVLLEEVFPYYFKQGKCFVFEIKKKKP